MLDQEKDILINLLQSESDKLSSASLRYEETLESYNALEREGENRNPNISYKLTKVLDEQNRSSVEEDELKRLCVYQTFNNAFNRGQIMFSLTPSQLEEIDKVYDRYQEKIKLNLDEKRKSLENLKDDIIYCGKCAEIKKKILEDQGVDIEENDIIFSLLKDSDLPLEVKINIDNYVAIMTQKYNENNYQVDIPVEDISDDEEEILENETMLDDDSISRLLQKYEYDYDCFSESSKKELKEFGNLERIEDILEELIPIKREINNSLGIGNNEKFLEEILVTSKKNIARQIVDVMVNNFDKSDSREYSHNIWNIIRRTSIWREQKTILTERKNRSKTDIHQPRHQNNKRSACSKNFILNVEYLKNKGFNITKLMHKALSTLQSSHYNIENNYNQLKLYGFDDSDIEVASTVLSTPSISIDSQNLSDKIDQFIELDLYDYILKNPSICNNHNCSTIIYRIKKAQIEGEEYLSSRNRYPRELKKEIQMQPIFGIVDIASGRKEINQYNFLEEMENVEYGKKLESVLRNNQKITFNNEILEDENIKILEDNFTVSPNSMVYKIDNILVSRLKVLRTYEALKENNLINDDNKKDALLYVIFRNGIYTKEEGHKIKNTIDGMNRPPIKR